MTCVSCGNIATVRAPGRPEWCSRYWWRLPAPTRAAYESGKATVRQIAGAVRERNASVRNFGGGRKR
jgi:hypothetical protein